MRALTIEISTGTDGFTVSVWNRINRYGEGPPFVSETVDRVKICDLEFGVPEGDEGGTFALQSSGRRMVAEFDTIRSPNSSDPATVAEINVEESGPDATIGIENM